MENLVFAILMLGCDHALDECTYVPTPVEFYMSRDECEEILPLAFHDAESYPVALGDCIAVPGDWTESDLAIEWSIDRDQRLKTGVVGPKNAVFGDVIDTELAGKSGRVQAG